MAKMTVRNISMFSFFLLFFYLKETIRREIHVFVFQVHSRHIWALKCTDQMKDGRPRKCTLALPVEKLRNKKLNKDQGNKETIPTRFRRDTKRYTEKNGDLDSIVIKKTPVYERTKGNVLLTNSTVYDTTR